MAHINDYVQFFEDLYHKRTGEGHVNCKTGSSRLLDIEMLRKSQDCLLCRTCVIKEIDKERRVDESVVRNIINEVTTNKPSNIRVTKQNKQTFH